MKKAFMVFCGCPCDGCLLVFAETRNEAKSIAVRASFDWEYIYINSKRVPDFDKFAEQSELSIIETNADLPAGAPLFYNEEIS